MTDYGDIDVEDIFTSDPVDDWLNLKLRKGIAPVTISVSRGRLQENRNGTAVEQFLNKQGTDILDASVQDFYDYEDHLREKGAGDRGVDNKLSEASGFYAELMTMKQTDSNPAGYVLSQLDLDISSPDRDYHTVEEIAGFLRFIPDPQIQTIGLYSLKYGLRRGACSNTDLQCVHLDHPEYRAFLEEEGIKLHKKVRDKPDTIYVYDKFRQGDVVEGEKRRCGNKRRNAAILPVDSELKHALLQYLMIRPRTDPPHPLFTALRRMNGEYQRMTGDAIYNHIIQKYARDYGIAEGSSREDVDFHYFRHFFSTQMTKFRGDHNGSLDDVLIKHIRGDKMDEESQDVLDEVYRHDSWGVNIRDEYLDNIYTFGLFD